MSNTIRTVTLIKLVETDLRAAFPEVEFTVTDWSPLRMRRRRAIEIFCCDGPDYAAVHAVVAKHEHHGVYLHVDCNVSCQRCGDATPPIDGFKFCVNCEPALWCASDEDEELAKQRLRAEAADILNELNNRNDD